MITHWYAPDFPGWSSRFSNSQSSIFVLSLDLASLILSRELVWMVQPTSLAGHLWVLHLSGTLGLGRQIRNTICRQSQYNPCSWLTIIWLVPKLLLWNTIGSLRRSSWRLGAAGSVTSIFFFPWEIMCLMFYSKMTWDAKAVTERVVQQKSEVLDWIGMNASTSLLKTIQIHT